MVLEITDEKFDEVLKSDKLVVVDFWAEWCGPCKMIGPVISQLAEEYDGKMVVGKCNVEDCEDIAMELGIRNIPTLIFFKNGEIVDKFVGAGNKATLQAKFEANL